MMENLNTAFLIFLNWVLGAVNMATHNEMWAVLNFAAAIGISLTTYYNFMKRNEYDEQ